MRCRSAAEALIWRIARDEAVSQRQRLVLDEESTALEHDARASAQRVTGDAAVQELQRSAWRPVGDRCVEESAALSAPARPVSADCVPAHFGVAQRQARLVDRDRTGRGE